MATFNCKNCGAPIKIKGDEEVVTCEYCDSVQEVPEKYRKKKKEKPTSTPVADGGARKLSKIMVIVIFIITAVVFIGIITGICFMVGDIKKSKEEMDRWDAQFEEHYQDAQNFFDDVEEHLK